MTDIAAIETATLRVGGPMLAKRDLHSRTKRKTHQDPVAWEILEPVIFDDGNEQFILLPNKRFVTVLAYKTGRKVAHFIPRRNGEEEHILIQSVCLANLPKKQTDIHLALQEQLNDDESDNDIDVSGDEDDAAMVSMETEEQILLVGCQDGSLREFALAELTSAKAVPQPNNPDCGTFQLSGPCFRPRRVFRMLDNLIINHLTAPTDLNLNDGTVLFSLSEKPCKDSDDDIPENVHLITQCLHRIMLPVFDKSLHQNLSTIPLKKKQVSLKEEIKCTVGFDKFGEYNNTSIFRLCSLSRKAHKQFSEQTNRDIFCVLARSNGFHIYHEHLGSTVGGVVTNRSPMLTFPAQDGDTLSSVVISPNGNDVTCGYWLGDVRVMTNVIPTVLDYHQQVIKADKDATEKPQQPYKSVLVRRVHWHAHPVMAMAYHGLSDAVEPMLYSGGEESVLVIWQLSKGTSGPADVLPRVALGGIVHIVAINPNGILIYCEDNSLQLVRAHNRKRIWKVHGLATPGNEATVLVDPKSDSHLVLTGLEGAPGCLHWFDPREEHVTCKLEVAPYNRVSRTEQADNPMPAPEVTQVAFSKSGDDVMTVEVIPTENAYVGAPRTYHDEELGTITAVKFWTHSPTTTDEGKRVPYVVSAIMTFPHGEENQVSSIALSPRGDVACTVSNDENAFRVWRRISAIPDEEDHTKSRRTPVWVCQYKVTTPAGFSNHSTSRGGACFSPDGSTLAICYGHLISLWNHKEAVLMHTIKHCDTNCIDSIQFISTTTNADMVMTISKSAVLVQSPFGSKGQKGWKCAVPPNCEDAAVLNARFLVSHEMVAISTFFVKKQVTKVLLLDATSGTPNKSLIWELNGKVISVVATGKQKQTAAWVRVGEKLKEVKETPVRLFAVCSSGEMMLLKTCVGVEEELSPLSISSNDQHEEENVPRIYVPPQQKNRKRPRASSIVDEEPVTKRAPTVASLAAFMGDEVGGAILTTDLPSLGGAFTRAFVGRSLARSTRKGGE